jgi:hypothetical protein
MCDWGLGREIADTSTAGRMPAIIGWGAGLSIVLTAFDYTGGLRGKKSQGEFADEYERKEYLRTNRRRPLTETVAELGEARGTNAVTFVFYGSDQCGLIHGL